MIAEIGLISCYLISMWKIFVKDYLSFTKKDRVGVIVLVMLICIVLLLPYLWPAKKAVQPTRQEIETIRQAAAQLNKADTAGEPDAIRSFPENPSLKKYYQTGKAEIFYFDPNTLDAAGWKRLGLRDKTVATIQHYLQKGGKFKKPEDLGKIYGLFKDDYARLLPYVQLKSETPVPPKDNEPVRQYATTDKPVYTSKKFAVLIDINQADTSALIALPGIGSKLAARIINFRSKLGGFYAVQQVAETYGLPDSTFARIQVLLQCNHSAVQQININTADANTLKQHPYIRWNLANLIVKYREQHGNFKSADDLLQLAIITPELLEKIKPYLAFQ